MRGVTRLQCIGYLRVCYHVSPVLRHVAAIDSLQKSQGANSAHDRRCRACRSGSYKALSVYLHPARRCPALSHLIQWFGVEAKSLETVSEKQGMRWRDKCASEGSLEDVQSRCRCLCCRIRRLFEAFILDERVHCAACSSRVVQ